MLARSTGMNLTLALAFLIAAIVCFAIATLLAVGAFAGPVTPWIAGGLLAFALAHLPLP